MKSSLRITTIALLLGGVLQVQNLTAAAASTISVETLTELGNPTGRFSRTNGPRDFATCIDKLVSQQIDQNTLRQTLTTHILNSTLPISFFIDARKAGNTNTKSLLFYCEGVKTGRLNSEEKIESLSKEVTSLQTKSDLLRAASTSLQQQLKDPEIHAFASPGKPTEVTAVETLPAYLEVESYPTQLALAEQMYLLKIRGQLTSRDALTASLTELDTLLTVVRNIASNEKTCDNLVRASFLVDAIPHIRGIVPIIGEYLQSVSGKVKAIDDAITARRGYFTRAYPTDLETSQLQELRARENLAYATFDAIFGTITKPVSVPSYVAFTTDPSPTNILANMVYTLHRSLTGTTITSRGITIKNDEATPGTIVSIGGTIFGTDIDMTTEYMTIVRTETTDFLKKMLAAKELVKTTFASATLREVSELPSVTIPAVVVSSAAAGSSDGGSSTADEANEVLDSNSTGGTSSALGTAERTAEKVVEA